MRRCTIWWLALIVGCTGGTAGDPAARTMQQDRAHGEVAPGVAFEVEEESEAPLFGAEAEEAELDEIASGLDDRGLNPIPAEPPADAGTPPAEGKKKPVRTWKRSQVVPNTSRLRVGDEEELPLKAMQATVRIDGFRARVVLDCIYENDRDQELEGTFQVRLPNDASPYYLGFGETAKKQLILAAAGADIGSIRTARREVWTQPKEARMVPKEKAAFAYTETVRRKVDPALLEWSGAGIFRARVFPLLPKKLHRIVVGYEVNLLPVGEDLAYRLDLPEKIPELKVDLAVHGVAHTIEPAGGSYRNPKERTFRVRVEKPGTILLHGEDPQAGAFFAAQLRPQLEAARIEGAARAVFLVDISLSANPERFNVWLELFEAILERNRPTLKAFKVLFFNLETFWWRDDFVPNTAENAKALLADAGRLALEGATDVGRALAAAAGDHDLFLLSDGHATWGESDLHAVAQPLQGALFAYDTGFAGTDKRLLAHLARASGGAVFSVVGQAEVARAATAHTLRPWRIREVTVKGGEDLLLAGRPTTVFPGQTLYLAGRGKPSGEIVLTLERDGATAEVTTKAERTIASDLAPSVFGQIAVGQLEEFGGATEEFARAYALHFRVVGKTCSLLMLESEEDYRSFNIKPTENAYVIRNHPTASLVAKTLAEVGERLGDPKAAFHDWLRRLARMPGFEFELPIAVATALEQMPRDSFVVTPDPLTCRARQWKDVPGAIQEQLAARKLTYDSMTKEAERRRDKLGAADGLRALSSLVEHSPGDTVLARDVGFTALEWGLGGQAYHLFRRVAHARPYEPHTYQAMAICLDELGKTDLALLCYEVARVGRWNERFGEFGKILSFDYHRFLRRIAAGERRCSVADFARSRLETVGKELGGREADLVVTIAWNTNGTDVDLHVIDPRGEECYYSHSKTKIGGRITRDVTTGYGPEMFLLANAVPGRYVVKVKYFSADANRVSARTKVYATIYEDWGRQAERATRKVVTLAYGKEMHEVAVLKR
ncbi:MAG: hypothetical protein ACYTEZ_05705 [Planctomycetota bacterium]|jgi:hypothetical protein